MFREAQLALSTVHWFRLSCATQGRIIQLLATFAFAQQQCVILGLPLKMVQKFQLVDNTTA